MGYACLALLAQGLIGFLPGGILILRGTGATTLPGAKLRRILQISVGAGVQAWSYSVFAKCMVVGWVGGIVFLLRYASIAGSEVCVSGKTSHLMRL